LCEGSLDLVLLLHPLRIDKVSEKVQLYFWVLRRARTLIRKVIAGIEQLIGKRLANAKASFEMVVSRASRAIQSTRADASSLESSIRSDGLRHLSMARQVSKELISEIRIDAMESVRSAAEQSPETFHAIKMDATTQMSQAKRDVPTFFGEIVLEARHVIRSSRADNSTLMVGVIDQAGRDAHQARTSTHECLSTVKTSAKLVVREAATRSEALMREIAGQGPAKTLGRGFALVSTLEGQPVTRASTVSENSPLEIQFSDGKVAATAGKHI
jgi:exodeoxyribonuclease VII large subunit